MHNFHVNDRVVAKDFMVYGREGFDVVDKGSQGQIVELVDNDSVRVVFEGKGDVPYRADVSNLEPAQPQPKKKVLDLNAFKHYFRDEQAFNTFVQEIRDGLIKGDGVLCLTDNSSPVAVLTSLTRELSASEVDKLLECADSKEVMQAFNVLLLQAVKLDALELCIDPVKGEARITTLIHGEFPAEETNTQTVLADMVTRMKVMANLDIGNTTTPQEGRFTLMIQGETRFMWVITTPTDQGETAKIKFTDEYWTP